MFTVLLLSMIRKLAKDRRGKYPNSLLFAKDWHISSLFWFLRSYQNKKSSQNILENFPQIRVTLLLAIVRNNTDKEQVLPVSNQNNDKLNNDQEILVQTRDKLGIQSALPMFTYCSRECQLFCHVSPTYIFVKAYLVLVVGTENCFID